VCGLLSTEYSEPLIDSNRGQVAGEDAETVSAITPAPMTLYWLAAAGHRPTVTSRRPVAPHNGDRRHLVVGTRHMAHLTL